MKLELEEVPYLEDSVHGLVLPLVQPNYIDDEIFVGSTSASFEIKELGINGTIALCF